MGVLLSEKNLSPIYLKVCNQFRSQISTQGRHSHSFPLHTVLPHWENRAAFAHGVAQLCLISVLQWSEVKFELRHLHMAPQHQQELAGIWVL